MMRIALLAGVLATVAVPAAAQLNISEPFEGFELPTPHAQPQPGMAPDTEHLLGDWGGLRPTLANVGIYLSFDALTVIAVAFTAALVPETKGRSLEEIEDALENRVPPAGVPVPVTVTTARRETVQ